MKYYLMIKEIEQTGLKYLCKRIQISYTGIDDHLSYKGSGTLWRKVLNKHPEYTIKTTVLGLFDKDELVKQGEYYSKLWNIVESNEWANLIPEKGDGGVTHTGTSPYIHESNTGRVVYRKLCPSGYIPYVPAQISRGKKIHNPITGQNRQLLDGELLPVGWKFGGIKGRYNYGPPKGECKVYNDGTKKVYIKEGDIIPDGFVPGVHYVGTTKNKQGIYNPLSGEKRYIMQGDELPTGFVPGLPATTGKHVQTPYGFFQTIAGCMRVLNMTRTAIFKNIKNDPTNWYIINETNWQTGVDIKTSINLMKRK